MKVILTCSCFNMEKKARAAFSALYPNEISPDLIKGRDRIYKFAIQTGNEHIKAISKLTGRYAYYIQLENGVIKKEYDLLRGKRIA